MLQMRKERLARGWTQEFVGKQVGVQKQAIQNLEAGKRKPSYELLVRLEDLYELGHRELMKECPLDYITGAK